MLAYARGVLGRRHASAADDVVQTVFCRILQLDRRTIRAVREVRPWLARLVRTQALNHLRTNTRIARRESLAAPTAAADPSVQPDLADALDRLPRRHREVLHLRHVAGLTTDQAALALCVPRGTVASRHHAAVLALRAQLETPPDAASDLPGEPAHVHAT
jgi:RNA polymerase sigma-70 factor (ECF subfamily)